jgi:PAS domain S-box-containing protein
MLERTLDTLGAEVIVPLQGQRRILGWLILGRRATGAPFQESDLQDVMILAERVAATLEIAVLYEDNARQKGFAEALLYAAPTGIVAAGPDGLVQWFNESAEHIMGHAAADIVGQPVEALGSHLAHLLRQALAGDLPTARENEWLDRKTKRALAAQIVRLAHGQGCDGVVAVIQDLTREKHLAQKQRELDRSAFWTELAASMSHEIRNPLVAIKTFAQLLPERYSDEDFRSEFSVLVSQEVDRLNSLIEQINSFAHLPEPSFERLDISDPVQEGVRLARLQGSDANVRVRTSIDKNVPDVRGDRRALVECFAHVVRNSLDALEDVPDAEVKLAVRAVRNGTVATGVEIVVKDNAGGIDPKLRDNIFSPFCTGRGGGMGLGLPIVQRTVTDHEGQVHIDSDDKGTTLTIALPAYGRLAEENHEASADR